MVKVDPHEVLRTLNLLAEPGEIVELRLLYVSRVGRPSVTMSGYFDRPEELVKQLQQFVNDSRGAYVTLNPINPALLARANNRLRVVSKDDALTGDGDVTQRRWLPLDFDPVRPSGISATDAEHVAAIDRARAVRAALRAEGWPEPVLGDSGNGAHLLYRVDLPSKDEGIVKRCLSALATRFDDEVVKIDQAVFNPGRIWKLYGTVSRKGDHLEQRPHRLARILEIP